VYATSFQYVIWSHLDRFQKTTSAGRQVFLVPIIVGVPRETFPDERRVALVPAGVSALARSDVSVVVESDAGREAGFPDNAYEAQGATIASDRAEIFASANVIAQVRGLGANPEAGAADLDLLRADQILLGLLDPLGAPESAQALAEKNVTSFALELLPRISRAQPMDVLSAMATIAGYKAVLLAAHTLPKMYPMMITAAGTITPAKVLIVGAGVAGLQAIASSRRLGAVVQAYDVRPAVKEQVESLGARFVELELDTAESETAGGYAQAMDEEFYRRQRELMGRVVAESDVVITTAAVPGAKAPVLLTEEMVNGMGAGSVIVDLAAETGGNCELTEAGKTVNANGVAILGPINLASTIPFHASQMYTRNVTAFLENLVDGGEVKIDLDDPIVHHTLLTHEGQVFNDRVRERLGQTGADEGSGD
jgi:NAD(P) transhydrogenase subunit alpha